MIPGLFLGHFCHATRAVTCDTNFQALLLDRM